VTTALATITAWTKRHGLTTTEKREPGVQGYRLMVTDENGYVADLWIVDGDLVEAATMSGAYEGGEFLELIGG
jgi:hypothetical protein